MGENTTLAGATLDQLRAELARRTDWRAQLEAYGLARSEQRSWWLGPSEILWPDRGVWWADGGCSGIPDRLGPFVSEEQAARAWLAARGSTDAR